LIVLVVVLIGTIGAPLLAPYDPYTGNLRDRLVPPMGQSGDSRYILGTDALGRDVLSRLLYGGQVSLLVGFASVALAGLVGATFGLLAGYFGGHVSTVMMRLTDIQLAVPFTVLAIAVAAALGPGLRNTLIVLVITGWPLYARLVRADVLAILNQEYIAAANAIGCGHVRTILTHVLPNAASSLIVAASLSVARMIIAEASLSFLGLGVNPPRPTWGGMIAEGRDYLLTNWWVIVMPGIALLITVMAINMFGDWLRDVMDPTLQVR
jgi:peptide/nickel transport system permease protein